MDLKDLAELLLTHLILQLISCIANLLVQTTSCL